MGEPRVKKVKLVTDFFVSSLETSLSEPSTSSSSTAPSREPQHSVDLIAERSGTSQASENCINDKTLNSPSPIDIAIKFIQNDGKWRLNENYVLTNAQKINLLTNHRLPDKSFAFLHGLKKSQKVYLSSHITGKNSCFKYSFEMHGVVCTPCVLFGQIEASNDGEKCAALKSLVTNPFTNYKKIHDKLKAHLCANFHTLAPGASIKEASYTKIISRSSGVLRQGAW